MFRIAFAVAAVAAGLLFADTASAHSHGEPTWAMDAAELQKLQGTIERHRNELQQAINVALESGVSAQTVFQRPYLFDSNQEVVDIPRSVLNRVIVESLNLEVASTKLYIFCDNSCDRSLFKDLAGEPNRDEAVKAVRGVWPKIASSFAILWRDIPVGVWKRLIHASRYSRSLIQSARYQSKAYGGISMAAGATAFGVAFGITEIAESMFMGPFHFVCQANYFWSVAIAAAVASFSRDIKTLFLFEKNSTSLFKRIAQLVSGYREMQATQRLEKRILFRTLVGEDAFEKLSRRDAHSGALEQWLETPSPRQAVAADGLLWSELAWQLKKVDPVETAIETDPTKKKMFGSEVSEIFNAEVDPKLGLRRWQDMHASLRTLLRILRNGIDVEHQRTGNLSAAIAAAGSLDRQLRTIDVFTQAWLMKRNADPQREVSDSDEAAKWLRSQLGEWLGLALNVSGPDFDSKDFKPRIAQLQSGLGRAVRSGNPERTCRALFLPSSN